ncbi:hypothetical protein B0T36_24965 [Nocardia donostiensis]|nr:phosphotransferase [Nocardia donostiensis]OQS12437.1 hypothetical protein B0T36_24965 [Nocardia donostiensis]
MVESNPNRVEWHELPQQLRREIEHRLGARVRSAVTQPGGFSHGMAARLSSDDGRTVFAKAIDSHTPLAEMYRAEAATAAALPPTVPVPALRFALDTHGWFVMVFDDIEGRMPRFDRPAELAAVLTTVDRLARALTPDPLPDAPTFADRYGPAFGRWRRFAEHGAPTGLDDWSLRNLDRLAELEATLPDQVSGDTLLHTDLRPDNLLIDADTTVWVLDWAWPCRGAAWIDLVALSPSIAAAGIDPDPILAEHAVVQDIDPAAVNAFLCALLGHWTHTSRLPAPPRSPHLRHHQQRSAAVTRQWLARRLAWT